MKVKGFLNIEPNRKQVISVVGAGGKTTLLYNISQELNKMNKRILLTTTTHIYMPPKTIYTDLFISSDVKALFKYIEAIDGKGIYVIGDSIGNEDKIKGVDISVVDKIYKSDIFDFILVEADGSKKKPIKAPEEHEPVVPGSTTTMIGVIGLDSLGQKAETETVHRLEEFCSICGCRSGDIINEAMIARLIIHPNGLFKNAPDKAEKIVLLNKADNAGLIEAGLRIKNMTKEYDAKLIMSSMEKDMYWM